MAVGSRGTAGNVYTGGQGSRAGRGTVYNPRTGETSTWSAGHSGNDFYASHDGHVYQRDAGGDWQQHSGGGDGGWSHVHDSDASRSLERRVGGALQRLRAHERLPLELRRDGRALRRGQGFRRR